MSQSRTHIFGKRDVGVERLLIPLIAILPHIYINHI